MTIWQLKDIASAPVLVTSRVIGIHQGERVPDGSLPWKAETLSMTADVETLRSFGGEGTPVAGDTLQIHFLAYGPSVTMSVNGQPPPLPQIHAGEVIVLPLQRNKNPGVDLWQLTADSGVGLNVPALADLPDAEQPPASGRAFLIRELANGLSRGAPTDVYYAAACVQHQFDDLSAELMPLLKSAIGDNRQRWAEVAASIMATEGIPRPTVADLLSSKALQTNPFSGSLLLARAVLQELKASPETDALLIRTLIEDAPVHAWGSRVSLLEFADNPVTAETLRPALQNDVTGSSDIALALARTPYHSWLPDAFARAWRVVDTPDADPSELQGATGLLREFGADEDLARLAGLVKKYQSQDEKFYRVLWQDATYAADPREERVLSVVLSDRRVVFEDWRYCDLAVSELERASKQQFGSEGKTMQERDAAVARAQAWLRTQGITPP